MIKNIETADPKKNIIIKGARVHNLKNVNVVIPRNRLVVVTGVSGSGKSSLTIDTLYAEGQRRYVESLSSYARQFLMRMDKPDVDYIKGISPAIAIEQKVITRTSRSTVGTLTEIYDYLRLLFARAGKTYSPTSGNIVKKHTVSDVVDYILSLEEGSKVQVFIPFEVKDGRTPQAQLAVLLQKGFTRIAINGKLTRIEEVKLRKNALVHNIQILIDRLVVRYDEDTRSRAADSAQTSFFESMGDCIVEVIDKETRTFNSRFELDGISFEEPNAHFFNFNNPYGACKRCEGFGHVIDIDENLVIPNRNLSIYEGAVVSWRGEKMKWYQNEMVKNSHKFDFPIHRAIKDLTEEEYDLLWKGNKYFQGLDDFFKMLEQTSHKIQYRVMLSRYRGRTLCKDCKGTRLRKDAQYVKISEKSIADLVLMPIKQLHFFFDQIELNEYEREVAKRILLEVQNRLKIMKDIGLGYLTLNRLSSTLSGGETQRINLTRSLGSNLTNSMYILDEPSIGLHPRDTQRLIQVLKELRNLGNTVVIVEHEEEIIRNADYIIDMGPMAGHLGGEVIFEGDPSQLLDSKDSLTADYLLGRKEVSIPEHRRKVINSITIHHASHHNLKDISATFPLNAITVVSGVSGSGKTSLVKDILYPSLKRHFDGAGNAPGIHKEITGDLDSLSKIELISQNPLGRSSRSNPVTYIKAYDAIRDLYSHLHLSKVNGFKPKHFSFNVEGGRCESCKGEGYVTIEMQFLADVRLKCEECEGKRFKPDVIDVKYKDKSIHDVLEMSVDEAIEFFKETSGVVNKIQPLQDVGLGYVKLGQSSSTLSGGEAQRVKLASYLGKGRSNNPILFIFDEPSTGLHFNDIKKLLAAFNALVESGHTIVIVEHNMDIIKSADWLIDLGPDGGDEGGYLLYQGEPEGLIAVENSYTAEYLKEKLPPQVINE
ncbi:MAG: excinuclease ABC subunit UvrA [Chitinophagales bacterium]